MRIIRGKYGRRRFDVPTNITARPTTDFARENIFNVLENMIDFEEEAPSALDLFAGTGAISFELLSRGCSRVTSVEQAATQANFIRKVTKELKADNEHTLVRGDVFRFIETAHTPTTSYLPTRPTTIPTLQRFQARCCHPHCCIPVPYSSSSTQRNMISRNCRISSATAPMAR